MPKRVLTAEDKAEILSAPEGTTATDLVRWLRRPQMAIAQFRRRVRRAGGWYTPVTLIACAECGLPLVSSYHRKVHRDCDTARRRSMESSRSERAVAAWDALGNDEVAPGPSASGRS